MDMDARLKQITARRTAAGLVANNGTACATAEQRDFINFRDEMKAKYGDLAMMNRSEDARFRKLRDAFRRAV